MKSKLYLMILGLMVMGLVFPLYSALSTSASGE